MTRKFEDRIKTFAAQERADKAAAYELAVKGYDNVFVSPDMMQIGAGSSRNFYSTFSVLRLPSVGDLAYFDVMHRKEWTIGGSFHVELLVSPVSVLGVADVQIAHRGWGELSGAPTALESSRQTLDFAPYSSDDLGSLNYWDVHTTQGDELVHGFALENFGIAVDILGAVVRHKADRV